MAMTLNELNQAGFENIANEVRYFQYIFVFGKVRISPSLYNIE